MTALNEVRCKRGQEDDQRLGIELGKYKYIYIIKSRDIVLYNYNHKNCRSYNNCGAMESTVMSHTCTCA